MFGTETMSMAFVGLVGIAVLGLLLAVVVRIRRSSAAPRRVEQRRVRFEQHSCPACRQELVPGFARANQGIHWFDRRGRISALTPIYRAIPNTLSVALRPSVLRAWRCEGCKLIVLDHSEPLDIR